MKLPSVPERDGSWVAPLVRIICRSVFGLLLIAPSLVFFGHFAYAVFHHDLYFHGAARILRYFVAPLLFAAAYLFFIWWAKRPVGALVAVHTYAVVGALVLFEIYAHRAMPAPVPGDKVAKVQELRAAGREAYPAFPVSEVNALMGSDSRESAAVSNLPHVTTVLCQNADGWVWFDADHEGFNNPIDRHGSDGRTPLSVAVVGDSFIQGMCLPREETIVGRLRQGGVAARGFGVLGNGPLIELETLKRHVHRHKPQDVVWCFYEGNDVQDLEAESRIPWLVEAIDSGPFHTTPEGARRVQQSIRATLDEQIAQGRFAPSEPSTISWTSVLGLRRSSLLLGLHYGRAPLPATIELFARVMRSAKEVVEGWGGRLHLCYLPEYGRYAGVFPARDAYDVNKDRILDVARNLNVDVIDVSARFDEHPSPVDLFDHENVHYTQEGAALAAAAIADALPHLVATADR